MRHDCFRPKADVICDAIRSKARGRTGTPTPWPVCAKRDHARLKREQNLKTGLALAYGRSIRIRQGDLQATVSVSN